MDSTTKVTTTVFLSGTDIWLTEDTGYEKLPIKFRVSRCDVHGLNTSYFQVFREVDKYDLLEKWGEEEQTKRS